MPGETGLSDQYLFCIFQSKCLHMCLHIVILLYLHIYCNYILQFVLPFDHTDYIQLCAPEILKPCSTHHLIFLLDVAQGYSNLFSL